MEYKFIEALPPLLYDTFVKKHKHCHLLQSAGWGEVKSNWTPYLTALENEEGDIVAAGLVLARSFPLGQSMWYLPKGPVLDYDNHAVRDAYLKGLIAFAEKKRVTLVKIDPPIVRRSLMLEDYPGTTDPRAQEQIEALEALGYIHQGLSLDLESTIQPRFSAITYNTADFYEQLPKRTKRFIRDTENRFVTVSREGREGLEDFAFLIRQTEENKDITLRDQAYFEAIWDAFGDDTYLYMARIDVVYALEQMQQQLAEVNQKLEDLPPNTPKKRRQLVIQQESYQKQIEFINERLAEDGQHQIVAGALGVEYGHVFELLYAGRNTVWGRIPAQDSIYVMSMQEAFERGMTSVSTGGVPGTLDDGLTKFKASFSPHFVETIGELDYPVKPLIYRGLVTAINLRNKLARR